MARLSLGIDCGSTTTKGALFDGETVVKTILLPTAARPRERMGQIYDAMYSSEVEYVVTTGYGRELLPQAHKRVTEITCHAKGAAYLCPGISGVVDIGGQDSKAILLDRDGNVADFVMNDKCAAGTGRFLEMMAKTMEMSLDELSKVGLSYQEDITISSMCTVFAESEVVSLIAQNKATDDIVHGLNKAVAAKTASLVKRVGGEEAYMMTGGVAQNQGLVKTLEERLGTKLVISDKSQLCGALGAALFATEM